MAEMTSKERVQKLFKREPVDRMPCFSGMGAVTIQAIREMKTQFAKIHTDAELMATSALTSAKMFGMDAAVIPYDMATMAEAMGRGLTLYADSEDILYPTVPNKWETLEEVDIPDDFMTRKRMPVVDEAFGLLKKDGELAVGAWVLGPFTLAGQVIELGLLLKGAKKNKEKVEAFLDKMTEATIAQAKRYESLGADFLNVREMGSGTDLLSPRMWKTLIKPNLTKVFDAVNIPTVNHICGSTDMIIEMMNECGADAISVDQKNTLSESRKKLGNDILIFGNFDPYGMLCKPETTAAEVEETIKKCIDDGVDAVWPGCDLWPDVKEDNMKAYTRTVREYGVKASPAVGRL